jgi:GNAT superfamily N-acetyltransferase
MITIHPCSTTDIPLLSEVATAAYLAHYTYLWHDNGEYYVNMSFSPDRFKQEMADTNARFYLIYLENEAVGFLKLNLDKGIDHYSADFALELERIYILPKATGQGVGKKVMDFVLDIARNRQKSLVWLKSMDSSKALPFYQRHGFQIQGSALLDFAPMKDKYRNILTLIFTPSL